MKRGNSQKENVTFRKAVNVKFPLRSGATHMLNSGEMEAVIMASFDNVYKKNNKHLKKSYHFHLLFFRGLLGKNLKLVLRK